MEAVIETLTVCCGPGPVLQKRWSYRCPCPLFPRAQSGHSRSAPKDALFTITEPSAAVAVNSRPARGELTAIYLCEPRKPYPIRHPEQRKDNTKSEYSGSRACPRLGTVRVEVSPAEPSCCTGDTDLLTRARPSFSAGSICREMHKYTMDYVRLFQIEH